MSRDLNDGVPEDEITDEPMADHATTPNGDPYILATAKGDGWFLASPRGGYIPVSTQILAVELSRMWGVNVRKDKDGFLPPLALFKEYGARVDAVVYTYTGGTAYKRGLDGGGTLQLRVVDNPPPRAVRHDDVLEWLHALCGDMYEKMLDWLATAPILDRPTCALVLQGPNSLGKSMVGAALAAYFGPNIASFDDVFKSRFNDALLRSPVVWLDEEATVAAPSAKFRKLTGNDRHDVEAKFQATGTLYGCPRLIVNTNGADPIKLADEDLSAADDGAIGVRILRIECQNEAGAWLEQRGGRAYTEEWVWTRDGRPGKIPETIAWLHQNRKVRHGSRFLVQGDANGWAAGLGQREGLPATVLDAVAEYFNGKHLSCSAAFTDGAHPDHILVRPRHLLDAWETLTSEKRRPSTNQLAGALSRLVGHEVRDHKVTLSCGSRVRAVPIPKALFGDRIDDEE
jgi:hypothetical protein